MTNLLNIPEISGIDARGSIIRIPPELDVPLTDRVRCIIDSPEFCRLKGIGQLGLVGLVYPAANHSRFEHSLGVYRLALLLLKRLAHDRRFAAAVSRHDAEVFIAAALLHDIGHWPFCHTIEDIRLENVPKHEQFAEDFLFKGQIADVLRDDWSIEPDEVATLLNHRPSGTASRILASMLSGPVDIDKMDYLARDSLHAGVPYGRHFDQHRLVGSLCLNESADGLAISEKGKTAAELMVFARYVMFSEVYWHHGVRAATAMLQRAFYLLRDRLDFGSLFRLTEGPMIETLKQTAGDGLSGDGPAAELLDGLFGPTRRLYKRLAQYSFLEQSDIYARISRRPYPWLTACSKRFAEVAGAAVGREIEPHEILFDAPPMEREVQFDVDIFFPKQNRYRPLDEVSPVVRTLAKDQFDDYVKQVRIFAHPRLVDELRELGNFSQLLIEAVERV